jgi:HAE1 family hydrophobic/amphiphilic exporter-1
VRASYPGADAQTVAATVATPIEQQVNGVENMIYMSSYSTSDGSMALTITFKLGTDLDQAQVLVQNRVAIATPRLPQEVQRLGITTLKSSPDLMMVVHMLSPDESYDQLYVSNYARMRCATTAAARRRRRLTIFGEREYRCASGSIRSCGFASPRRRGPRRAGAERAGLGGRSASSRPARQRLPAHRATQGRFEDPRQFRQSSSRTATAPLRLRTSRESSSARRTTSQLLPQRQPAVALAIFQRPAPSAAAARI